MTATDGPTPAIPDEWVEPAAAALYESAPGLTWEQMLDSEYAYVADSYRATALTALAAVVPLIEEAVGERIAAAIEAAHREAPSCGPCAYGEAAHIARAAATHTTDEGDNHG